MKSNDIGDLKSWKFKAKCLIKTAPFNSDYKPLILQELDNISMPIAIYGRTTDTNNFATFIGKLCHHAEHVLLKNDINPIIAGKIKDYLKLHLKNK